jgi:HAE1 family hydrophobic/amphiphilic exporter-1
MVAGMVPSALSLGDGGEFRAPMACGVIGGLLVSTVLSLVFVPSLYTMMDGLSRAAARWFAPLLSPGAARPKRKVAGVGEAVPVASGVVRQEGLLF